MKPLSPCSRLPRAKACSGQLLLALLLCCFLIPASAQSGVAGTSSSSGPATVQASFPVRGVVRVRVAAPVYLQLVTKAQFAAGKSSAWGVIVPVTAADLKKGWVRFEFASVPPGEYGIQGFQDLNGNKSLDIGLFGPTEPWGTSRSARPALRGPMWEEIAFRVSAGMPELDFTIE